MDIIKEVAKLIPIVRDGPLWLQILFAVALISTSAFAGGLGIHLVTRGASVNEFTVLSPREKEFVPYREIELAGKGLPDSDRLRIEVTCIEGGHRTSVFQADVDPDRRPDHSWRFASVRLPNPGGHEISVRVLRSGKVITYADPIHIYVGDLARAPVGSQQTKVVEVKPVPDFPSDLSPFVARIYDQGQEGSSPGFAAVTAMEVAFAASKQPRSLSARYVYDKARIVGQQKRMEGAFMTSIAFVIQKYGAPPSSVWPYTSGNDALPPGLTWEQLDELASQNRVRLIGPVNIDEIPAQLKQQRPLIAAVHVYESWMNATGPIDALPKDRELGMHAVVIVGFNEADRSIKFANSWGTAWGQKGFGILTEAGARAYLVQNDIWAVEAVTR